jgi:streptogramin lyase
VFIPPDTISPVGGAVSVDHDGKGKIWVSSATGALRFDPDTSQFKEYKSITLKDANGLAPTYGVAGDADGNGWWAQMMIGMCSPDGTTGEIKLPPVGEARDLYTPDDLKFFATYRQPDFNSPLPWAHGPRRMAMDKKAGILWIGNSHSSMLTRIDTRTRQFSFVKAPPLSDRRRQERAGLDQLRDDGPSPEI